MYEHPAYNSGGGITTPPDGIWVGEGVYNSGGRYEKNLLKHEYGHWLQYEDNGFFYYYSVIAPASFYFAKTNNWYGWTELDANNRAYNFFNQPSDWNIKLYPLKK